MAGPPVTIAVVSYETRDLLDRALRSMRPEHEAGRAAVHVVDNASTDGSAALVRDEHPWVTLHAREDNLGFGRAVNVVDRATDSPFLAAANADVALTPGALERLLATAHDAPDIGAVAPRLRLPDGSTQHSVYAFPTVAFAAAFALGAPALGDRLCLPGRWDPDRRRTVPWAVGAFLLLRREAFRRAGGFDEDTWLYAEDLDLGWRLRRHGFRTVYEPEAVVLHDESAATDAAFGASKTDRTQAATYAWMRRRRGPARTMAVAVLSTAGAAARAAATWPAARSGDARAQHRHAEARRWAARHARGLRP